MKRHSLNACDVQLYRFCEDLTEPLIYGMVVFSPWAFGTTQHWSIWVMNGAGYGLGLLLAGKLAVRWGSGNTGRRGGEKGTTRLRDYETTDYGLRTTGLRDYETTDHGQGTSNIQHPTSNIQHPTSNIQHPTSNIQHPTSNIQHPTSNIEERRSEQRRSKSEQRRANIQYRRAKSEERRAKSEQRTSNIQERRAKSEERRAEDGVSVLRCFGGPWSRSQ